MIDVKETLPVFDVTWNEVFYTATKVSKCTLKGFFLL